MYSLNIEGKLKMSQFNEGLSTFLVGCREGALEELKSDTRYANLKTKQANLYTKLYRFVETFTRD